MIRPLAGVVAVLLVASCTTPAAPTASRTPEPRSTATQQPTQGSTLPRFEDASLSADPLCGTLRSLAAVATWAHDASTQDIAAADQDLIRLVDDLTQAEPRISNEDLRLSVAVANGVLADASRYLHDGGPLDPRETLLWLAFRTSEVNTEAELAGVDCGIPPIPGA